MDTGSLNQLHDTGNEDIAAIADGIDLNLAALDILVNQNGLILVDLNGGAQIVAELILVCDDLHRSASENEGGTYKHGVSDLCGYLDTVLDLCDSLSLCSRDVKLVEKVFKLVTVLCTVNSSAVGTDDFYPTVVKRLSKVDSSLTAE